jgi:hypothetical protein
MEFVKKIIPTSLQQRFIEKASNSSDINEHIPTLFRHALECNHITECGVRSVVSSYAFAFALKTKNTNKLVQVDLDWHPNLDVFKTECAKEGVNVVFYKQSDLECPIEKTDLLFIDTWHIYGHLKRELERWNSHVGKYIILHDTTVDEWEGESVRMQMNIDEQIKSSGYPREEITKGLWPAVEEFLQSHSEWTIKERYTHNNGLTILSKNPDVITPLF